jgi:hypothetical protein
MAYRFSEIITQNIDDINDDSKKLIIDLSGATTDTSTTFRLNQTVNRILNFPDASGTLMMNDDDRLTVPQVVNVKTSNAGEGEFTDVASAIASITDASSIKPYLVRVYPGVYMVTGTITIPSNVTVRGVDNTTCLFVPIGDFTVFELDPLTRLSEVTITNGGATNYAIHAHDIGAGAIVDRVTLVNCPYGIKCHGVLEPISLITLSNVIFSGTGMIECIKIIDSSGTILLCQVDSTTINGHCDTSIITEGSGARGVFQNCTLYGDGSGNAFCILDGSTCDARSIEISNYTNGFITGDNILNNPNLIASSIIFTNCSKNINITNRSTIGHYEGITEFAKTVINPFCDFFVSGKTQNVIVSAIGGGDFTSINDAINAVNPTVTITTLITDTTITSAGLFTAILDGVTITGTGIPASTTATFVDENTMTLSNAATASGTVTATFIRANASNVFTIEVGPGTYNEPDFTVPQNVSIIGSDQTTTIITPQDISGTLVTLLANSSMRGLTISGITNGIGIFADSVLAATFQNCVVINCNTCVKCTSTTGSCRVGATSCVLANYTTGVLMDGTTINTGSNIVEFNCLNFNWIVNTPLTCEAVSISGPNANIIIRNALIDGRNNANTTGFYATDGCKLHAIAVDIDEVENGIIVDNIGDGPDLKLSNVVITEPSTIAINVLHPATTGVLSIVAERSKIFIDPDSTISVEYIDAVVNGKTIVGSLFLGRNNATSTDVIELVTEVPPMGLVNGGNLIDPSGLMIDISGGFGYLSTGTYPDQVLKKITWNTQTFDLSANVTEYIYFDSNGDLTKNPAKPSNISSILLGRIRTDSSGVELIDATPMNTYHISNAIDNYSRDVYGSIFASGSIVTGNSSRELAISSGRYYFSENVYNPSGQSSPATFTTYYHNGTTTFDKTGAITVVDNAQYDDGTNLVPNSSFSVATISADTTNTSTTLTSAGLFYAALDDLLVTGLGIPNNTHASFVDANTMTLTNPAVATGTGVSIKFYVDGALTIGKTDLSDNITSAGLFTNDFIGATVTGSGIPASTTVTAVIDASNATISNPASTTESITATFTFDNRYTKHSLYLVGEGANEKYMMIYSQATYDTLNAAQGGSLPTPPNYFTDGIVVIAGLIVQDGSGSFISTISERPLPSFSASAVSSSIFHSSLIGLLNDDHPQYLLVNGTRAMAADLDMGAFSITNVNLVDGVTVSAHASRHLPNGADSLTTAAPITNLSATTTNLTGTANSLARSDHLHAINTGTPSTQTPDQSNTTGTSASLARADHIHNIPTAAPVSIGSSNSQGAAATFARSDHVHQGIHALKANSGGTNRFGDLVLQQGNGLTIVDNGSGTFTFDTTNAANELVVSAGAGLNANYTAGRVNINGTITNISASSIALTGSTTNGTIYVDTTGVVAQSTSTSFNPNVIPLAIYTTDVATISSITDRRTFINRNIVFGLAGDITNITATASAAAGTTNRYAMADHQHTISTGAPSTQTPDQSNTTGTSANLARADHIHNIPTATPVSIGASNSQGVAATFARSDHVHQGVHSINANGGSQENNDITLQDGNDILITNASGTFTIATDGTPNNTASTLVKRDVSGNFAAGTITSALTLNGALSLGRVSFNNANTTVTASNCYVAQTGTMTASRTVTLPLAANLAGQVIVIADESGTVTNTNTLVVTRAGSDTIDGSSTFAINVPYGSVILISDGTSKWTIATSDIINLSSAAVTGVLPIVNGGTNSSIALTNNKLMVSSGGAIIEGTNSSTPTFTSETLTATTNQLTLGTTNTTTISATAPSTSRTITIPDPATATSSFSLRNTTSAPTNGQILIGNGTAAMTPANLTSTVGSITITNGSGSINLDTTQGPNELVVTAGAGLNANYTAGRVGINNTFTNISASSIALTGSTTNGTIFVNASGVVSQSTSTTFSPNTVPLATYTTGVATITSITDVRTFINRTRPPIQLHMKFGTGTAGNLSIVVNPGGGAPTAWVSSASFIFKGGVNGTTTGRLGFIVSLAAGTTFEGRIQDVTNATTIATTSLPGALTQAYVESTTLSNVPTGDAVFEVQFRRSAGAGNNLTLFAAYFEY